VQPLGLVKPLPPSQRLGERQFRLDKSWAERERLPVFVNRGVQVSIIYCEEINGYPIVRITSDRLSEAVTCLDEFPLTGQTYTKISEINMRFRIVGL
jgi:hypothetical protein